MAIKYQPKTLLKKLGSKKKLESLVTENLTINRAALNAVHETGFLGKKALQDVSLAVIKDYRQRSEKLREEDGLTKAEAKEEVLENKKLLVHRVRNATIKEITKKVKEKYWGEFYIWLPSTALNPDPAHKKKYGKRYRIGKGEAPGDRDGCQCGMEILVAAKQLRLD